MSQRVLVACAHGTRKRQGQRALARMVEAVRLARPELDVRQAFVDVQEPLVADVVRQVTSEGRPCVVVPLLLSTGYHVEVDISQAVNGTVSDSRVALAARPLGPDDRLAQILRDRLEQAGLTDGDAVVLAAAGSSDPRAAQDVEAVAAALAQTHGGPVSVGYAATGEPSVARAVATARRSHPGRGVLVGAYLLAPGHFHSLLSRAGADAVSAALVDDGPVDPRLVAVVLDRFDSAGRARAQN